MLELNHIFKRFGDKQIFDDFHLSIDDGEIVSLVGPSGGGKTTLLKMLAGLEKIDSGEIFYRGEKLGIEELKSMNLVGFVFQEFHLFPHLSVLDNLILSPIKTMHLSKEIAIKKALKWLHRLGLEEYAKTYPHALSGGQKQRVAFARAMMIDPKIICYDEPTSALDPELRQEVARLILQNRTLGLTQIVVTHDLPFAEMISDKMIRVNPKEEGKKK